MLAAPRTRLVTPPHVRKGVYIPPGIYDGLAAETLYGVGFAQSAILPTMNGHYPTWLEDRYTVPLSGLARLITPHPNYCTTDTAGGTPCGDGDLIRWWLDRATGVWYEQATSGDRATLRANGTGWYADLATGKFHLFGSIGVGTRHIGLSIRQTVTGTLAMVLSADGQDLSIRKGTTTTIGNVSLLSGTVVDYVNAVATTTSGGLNVDEVYQGTGTGSAGGFTVRLSGSSTFGTGRRFNGRFYGGVIYTGTTADLAEVQDFLADKYATS